MSMTTTRNFVLSLVLLTGALLLFNGGSSFAGTKSPATATANGQAIGTTAPAEPVEVEAEAMPARVPDPLYGWNKFWFTFNDVFYSRLMRPLAKGYKVVVPKKARTGLSNAYDNFTFPIRFVNCLLQLNFAKASKELGRFIINSTFGVGGLMDLAKSDPNLQPGNEDFGQTLGHYGMPEGFYIVWPFLGPSTLRDSFGMAGDAAANPLTWIFGPWSVHDDYNPWYWSYVIKGADVFNRLPETLEGYDAITKPAIEPYTAMKDAYIQYRRHAVEK